MKLVLRRLSRSPLFAGVTLLTLAIGIGANTAIFSVLNGVLLKPLPYRDSGRLVSIWETAHLAGFAQLIASPATYFTFREENRTLEDIGLWRSDAANITGSGEPEQVETSECDRWRAAHPGRAARTRALVHAQRRSAGQPAHRHSFLRLLAAQVWRRSLGHRPPHRGGWQWLAKS